MILLVAPHVVGTTLVELLPESANQEENNAILCESVLFSPAGKERDWRADSSILVRSVVLPLMLILSVAYATSRYLEAEASVIRQKVIEAEYVVEERVENYVPPANDGGQSGKLGSGGAGPGSIGDNAEKVAVIGEGDDDWEDM